MKHVNGISRSGRQLDFDLRTDCSMNGSDKIRFEYQNNRIKYMRQIQDLLEEFTSTQIAKQGANSSQMDRYICHVGSSWDCKSTAE